MAVMTTAFMAGAYMAGTAATAVGATAGVASAAAAVGGAAAAYGAYETIGSGFDIAQDFMEGPEIPDAPTPEAAVDAGDEGIRRGEMARMRRKKAMGQAFLTKGQERDTGATLASMANTLG